MFTLTQLEYLVAVDTYRHFGKAAESCFVTQPTLSMQIKKFEEDLGVVVFDRTRQPLITTTIGQHLIEQARIILAEAESLNSVIKEYKDEVSGVLRIGVIPTLAPYLLPLFIGNYKRSWPHIVLKVEEVTTMEIVEMLGKGLLDVGILVTPLKEDKIVEKPVFYEEMLVYANKNHSLHQKSEITLADVATPDIWLLSDGHCFRDQVINLCSFASVKDENSGANLPFQFEVGALETLMNIVDIEGGITLVPELAKITMSERRRENVLSFADFKPLREVSLVHMRHFAKNKQIALLAQEVKKAVPTELLNPGRGKIVEWR